MQSRHGRSLSTVKKLSNSANITYSGVQWDSNSNSVTQRPSPVPPPPVPTLQLSPLLLAHEMLNTQPEGKGLNILGQDHHQPKYAMLINLELNAKVFLQDAGMGRYQHAHWKETLSSTKAGFPKCSVPSRCKQAHATFLC